MQPPGTPDLERRRHGVAVFGRNSGNTAPRPSLNASSGVLPPEMLPGKIKDSSANPRLSLRFVSLLIRRRETDLPSR